MDAKDNPNEDVIDKVEVFIIRAPLGKAKFWSSQASFPERNSLLVKITSSGCNDDGKKLVGWGEAGQYGPPEPVASAIEHVLAPRIMGQQILPTKVSIQDMHCSSFVLNIVIIYFKQFFCPCYFYFVFRSMKNFTPFPEILDNEVHTSKQYQGLTLLFGTF